MSMTDGKKDSLFPEDQSDEGLSDLLCKTIPHSSIKKVLYPVLTYFLLGDVFCFSQ